MEYRVLGRSGIKVSEISLGSWLTYGVGVDDSKGRACLDAAFEAGINFIDTSNIYGVGAAEEFLGRALKGRKRDSYVLATKLYFPMTETDKGLSRAQVRKQLDASLERLGTEYVDLYQCHRYDDETPLQETLEALSEAVKSGKARSIGFSEWSERNIQDALKVPGVERFCSSQPQYSILWRKPEAQVFPLCHANGVSQIVWSPLGQGVLTGKYKKGQAVPQDSRAASPEMSGFMGRWLTDAVLDTVERLRPLAAGEGLTLSQLSLAWVLRRAEVASAIIGASRPEQVAENCKASGKKLSGETLAAIDAAVAPLLASR
jgi:aryl-alcohol dehydrogenase-like predicted oxidoreductase